MDAIKTFKDANDEGKLDMFEEAYDGWLSSNAVLIERDARIAALEAELADARTANEMAAKRFKEFEADGAAIRDLREQLNAANTAASANLRMASEQAHKVGALKMAIIKIALICNAELFDCEDVKREDLIDTAQAYFDIQQITDGILEATK